jgi:hypothetical protein
MRRGVTSPLLQFLFVHDALLPLDVLHRVRGARRVLPGVAPPSPLLFLPTPIFGGHERARSGRQPRLADAGPRLGHHAQHRARRALRPSAPHARAARHSLIFSSVLLARALDFVWKGSEGAEACFGFWDLGQKKLYNLRAHPLDRGIIRLTVLAGEGPPPPRLPRTPWTPTTSASPSRPAPTTSGGSWRKPSTGEKLFSAPTFFFLAKGCGVSVCVCVRVPLLSWMEYPGTPRERVMSREIHTIVRSCVC